MDYIKNLFQTLNHVQASNQEGEELDFQDVIEDLMNTFETRNSEGKKIMTIGNGGSAAIASHTTNDFIKNAEMAAYCFNDYSVLTCLSNDFGYEHSYEVAIERMATDRDILIAVSSSGKSKNILLGVEAAKKKKCYVLTLSGFDAHNPLRDMGDADIYSI